MKPVLVFLAMVAAATVLAVGCGQAAPAPSPTQPPAAPTKAAAPAPTQAAPAKAAEATKPAAAAPTKAPEATKPAAAAPAPSTTWPEKGKTLTVVWPFQAGSTGDLMTRLQAPIIEKELGVTLQVIAKPGASGQLALTEVLKQAKPDGYTAAIMTIPAAITIYLDESRNAAFTRKDIGLVASLATTPAVFFTKPDGPYKTMKDLVDAAKANPGKLKGGTTGLLSPGQIAYLDLERLTGAKIKPVHFDGVPAEIVAIMGGNIDVGTGITSNTLAAAKSGQIRVVSVLDTQKSKVQPDVPTAESQGYPVYMNTTHGWLVPSATPKDVVAKLAATLKKIFDDKAILDKMAEMGVESRFRDTAEYTEFWDKMETMVKPMIALSKAE